MCHPPHDTHSPLTLLPNQTQSPMGGTKAPLPSRQRGDQACGHDICFLVAFTSGQLVSLPGRTHRQEAHTCPCAQIKLQDVSAPRTCPGNHLQEGHLGPDAH
ncbi:Ferredoxin-Fold Anticodon-Binding Domain-Containing Protein 1 [Manis pentadactyla]|nr:Ferredoxin-Fold Anticodon-Binding Domain-Containing Protein 1 [Manis pentadactyla]